MVLSKNSINLNNTNKKSPLLVQLKERSRGGEEEVGLDEYMDQVKDKTGVASYQEVKDMAYKWDKWKVFH